MKVSDLDYHLPPELIAQQPLADRSASRMLVVVRQTGQIQDRKFRDLKALLSPSDFLVLNNSRVLPARLLGKRDSGGRVEILLLRPIEASASSELTGGVQMPADAAVQNFTAGCGAWQALAKPKRKLRARSHLHFSADLEGTVVDLGPGDKVVIEFNSRGNLYDILEKTGHVPLPPYIHRADSDSDRQAYQTVYAEPPGSVAAPTAGLHFTQATLDQLKESGIRYHFITLHVGYGTFQPMKTEAVGDHRIDAERFVISDFAAVEIRRNLRQGKRLIAVGTTTTRVLEFWKRRSPALEPLAGETDLFIYPPFQFQIVQGMLTNFHLPRSSLFALVCALLGVELAHGCYRHAVQQRYRFYSYGDCMLIL
ncbi:MAG: tRNA preQ1(34) S-adenosylmethionine ribosyltransferase-isomerase QueA [Acidobacteria bacterium]|nr:tRNA preQ1(34) S-adenosylmethionine ribosyltransferase-isomerase QueA [Acidobacteriota bacterium]